MIATRSSPQLLECREVLQERNGLDPRAVFARLVEGYGAILCQLSLIHLSQTRGEFRVLEASLVETSGAELLKCRELLNQTSTRTESVHALRHATTAQRLLDNALRYLSRPTPGGRISIVDMLSEASDELNRCAGASGAALFDTGGCCVSPLMFSGAKP